MAFLGSTALAATADLNLSPAQKQTIFQSVMNERGQAAPAGFQAKVGKAIRRDERLDDQSPGASGHRRFDDVRRYHQIVIKKARRAAVVRDNAAHARRRQENGLGAQPGKERFDLRLTAKIGLAADGGQVSLKPYINPAEFKSP